MKEHIVFYHANCADGLGPAFAAWVTLGDSAEYVPCNYNEPIHPADWIEQISGRDVHILDFSFPRPVMELTLAHAQHVTWLDHHRTAFEMWCPGEYEAYSSDALNHKFILDNSRSGALISWQHYCPQFELPLLIRCIDDRDRWQFKFEESWALHAGLWAERPWTFEQWKGFTNLVHNGNLSGVFFKGRTLLANDKLQRDGIRASARACEVVLDPRPTPRPVARGLAVNSPLYISELGNELAQQSGTFGLVWYVSADGQAQCSFRSIGDYDVSRIAKWFGGGGHKNAAGCRVEMGKLLEWLK